MYMILQETRDDGVMDLRKDILCPRGSEALNLGWVSNEFYEFVRGNGSGEEWSAVRGLYGNVDGVRAATPNSRY